MEPKNNCKLCKRLVKFRNKNKILFPGFFNNRVLGTGPINSNLLIVGLAPGLKGANRTGIPFKGDFSGELLLDLLFKNRLLIDSNKSKESKNLMCRITNAVKCLPPKNKPNTLEIKQCNTFLKAEICRMINLKVILTLGEIAHKSTILALNKKVSEYKFQHFAKHVITKKILLINSYHCSKYNINTKKLNISDLDKIFKYIKNLLSL